MTPEEAQDVRFACCIVRAFLVSDRAEIDRLLTEQGESRFNSVADAHTLLALVAASQLAMLQAKSVPDTLRALPAVDDTILPGLVLQHDDAVELACARLRSGDAARIESASLLDVPTAVNSAFELAMSALRALAQKSGKSELEWIQIYIAGIDEG